MLTSKDFSHPDRVIFKCAESTTYENTVFLVGSITIYEV